MMETTGIPTLADTAQIARRAATYRRRKAQELRELTGIFVLGVIVIAVAVGVFLLVR